MKKRLMALMLALTLAIGMTMTASAEISPQGEKDTTETEDKADTAPKTGESNIALYGMGMAALLAGVTVVAKKQMDAAN